MCSVLTFQLHPVPPIYPLAEEECSGFPGAAYKTRIRNQDLSKWLDEINAAVGSTKVHEAAPDRIDVAEASIAQWSTQSLRRSAAEARRTFPTGPALESQKELQIPFPNLASCKEASRKTRCGVFDSQIKKLQSIFDGLFQHTLLLLLRFCEFVGGGARRRYSNSIRGVR